MSRILNPGSVWLDEHFLICKINSNGYEVIIQSESTCEKADYSVEILNEYERNNARRASYYWRPVRRGETISCDKKHLQQDENLSTS